MLFWLAEDAVTHIEMPLKRETETSQLIDYGNADYRPIEHEIFHEDLMDADDPEHYMTSSAVWCKVKQEDIVL